MGKPQLEGFSYESAGWAEPARGIPPSPADGRHQFRR